jgi:hypothetical protein
MHIKHRFFFFLALILIAAGCTTTNVEDGSYYLDAVHRVADPGTFTDSPFQFMARGGVLEQSGDTLGAVKSGVSIDSLEKGQKFDAAVGLFRAQKTNGFADPNEIPIGRMAFELNNVPAQVGSATLNNNTLAWLPSGSAIGWDWSYGKADPNLFGSQDSMAFSYVDFGGETYKDTVRVAPGFGAIKYPDTISLSKGCIISYQHSVPNDSIGISLNFLTGSNSFIIRPDSGSIVLAPNELPAISDTRFTISFIRWNWSTRISPSGKKIGIYSSMETEPVYIPYKP